MVKKASLMETIHISHEGPNGLIVKIEKIKAKHRQR